MILRGCNLIPAYGDADTLSRLNSLRAQGANHVRWGIYLDQNAADVCSVQEYRNWLVDELHKLSLITPTFTALGLYAIIDLHVMPGGSARLWTQGTWQTEFVRTWQQIATCCVSQPNIPYYGLMNEPLGMSSNQWVALAQVAIRAIRAIEPNKKILISSKGGAPNQLMFLPYIPGVGYEFHMYEPGKITNQGIPLPGWPPYPRIYTANDSNNVRISMQRVAGWQRTKFRNAEIFMGEFDCIRWAPQNGSYRWMKDVIRWANTYKWHWSFLDWRDPGATFWDTEFSTEYCPDGSCATERKDTDRSQLLRKGYQGSTIL